MKETAPAPLTDAEMAALLAAHGMALPVPPECGLLHKLYETTTQ